MSYERPMWAGGQDMPPQHMAQMANMGQQGGHPQFKHISIDVNEFVRTRDALAASYLNLSGAFERAVKAYLDHTQVVLNGDQPLHAGQMLSVFTGFGGGSINPSHIASMALQQNGGMNPQDVKQEEAEGQTKKRKKRAYKQRDPNAPKRPLTAYFRYLGDVRASISEELQKNPENFKDVAGQPGDISRIATQRWQQLSEAEKEPYKDAYKKELVDYNAKAAEYAQGKGVPVEDATGVGDADIDATGITEADAPGEVVPEETPAKVDNDDSGSGSSSSSSSEEDENDDSSEDSEDDEPAPPAPAPVKQATPKKSAMKKGKAPAAAPAIANQTFSSMPTPSFNSVNTDSKPAASPSPSRKRKGSAEETEGGKKRSRKSKGDAVAGSDPAPAAPVAAMASSPEVSSTPAAEGGSKKKKDKKKKGKGTDA